MKLRLTRTQVVLVAVVLFVFVFLIGIFVLFRRQNANESPLGGQLTIWGVYDSADAFDKVFDEYKKKYPQVDLTYVEKNPTTYEAELINALASPNPPDVFMFHNSWLPKHADKIQPLPPSYFPIEQFTTFYPTAVVQDFAPDGAIYAFPLYLDTLALYYNQDIFDQKGVPNPPKNWSEFQKLIPRIRQVNPLTSRVEKAAAAIGGSNRSINRMADLLSLLMIQTGTKMVSDDFGAAEFSSPQGLQALDFYIDFANPASPYYTWSDAFSYSLDAFAQGDAAMMFNYQYQANSLKEKNPFLNFRIVPMLQPEGATETVNYANYWGLAVGLETDAPRSAWNFVMSIATDPEVAPKYLEVTGHPPAPRALIEKNLNHPDFGVFARQALTARTWPQIDNAFIDETFSRMITSILAGRPSAQALREAAESISDLMVKKQRQSR